MAFVSEIRESDIRDLIEKVRRQNYLTYLSGMRLDRIRLFQGAHINFDFPVTALIGPNGGGKSTILGAAACIYNSVKPKNIFRKSRIGDDSMDDWRVEYDLIDKRLNSKGLLRTELLYVRNTWSRSADINRNVLLLGINRTVPPIENSLFTHKRILSVEERKDEKVNVTSTPVEDIEYIKVNAEKILGKSLADFQLLEILFTTTTKSIRNSEVISQDVIKEGDIVTTTISRRKIEPIESMKIRESRRYIFVGDKIGAKYSEFNFGAGEASVIHMVADIETQNDGALILIEEIENGLHPLAVQRMVEYLIDVSKRKNIQAIFTTHSDYALRPLPSEAIWASIDGKLQQGKLTVEVLRSISGRIDKRLAVFVEDNFSKYWIEAILREKLADNFEEIGVYAVFGDSHAVNAHTSHITNPAIEFHSLCFIDGDSKQADDSQSRIFRLPGSTPETTIFNSVLSHIENNIALLTVACQRPHDKQDIVREAIKSVSRTNRDPHLLFNQVGMNLSFTPEEVIRGAFLTIWIQENPDEVEKITAQIKSVLDLEPKRR
jgi:AAA15 family ATPase/GTPase